MMKKKLIYLILLFILINLNFLIDSSESQGSSPQLANPTAWLEGLPPSFLNADFGLFRTALLSLKNINGQCSQKTISLVSTEPPTTSIATSTSPGPSINQYLKNVTFPSKDLFLILLNKYGALLQAIEKLEINLKSPSTTNAQSTDFCSADKVLLISNQQLLGQMILEYPFFTLMSKSIIIQKSADATGTSTDSNVVGSFDSLYNQLKSKFQKEISKLSLYLSSTPKGEEFFRALHQWVVNSEDLCPIRDPIWRPLKQFFSPDSSDNSFLSLYLGWFYPILFYYFQKNKDSFFFLHEGRFSCFESNDPRATKSKATCEPSAAHWENSGQTITVLNDKNSDQMPSPIISLTLPTWSSILPNQPNKFNPIRFAPENTLKGTPLLEEGSSIPDSSPLLAKRALKFEDSELTTLFGTPLVFATTGFDRWNSSSPNLDLYNMLMVWPQGSPDKAVIVGDSSNTHSVALRSYVLKSLTFGSSDIPRDEATGQFTYMKIEGLSIIPTGILFGIREKGQDSKNMTYSITLVHVPFKNPINAPLTPATDLSLENALQIDPKNTLQVYDFSVNEAQHLVQEKNKLAISSITYDNQSKSFILLTSFENEQNETGAYLWRLTYADFLNNKAPKPIRDIWGNPIRFGHKAEAVALSPQRNQLLVVHDDDRNQCDNRPLNEANYTIFDTTLFGSKTAPR